MAMYLTQHTKYAPKGSLITIFKKPHPTVWLAEYKGDKFPVSPELLSDTPPVDDDPATEIPSNPMQLI